jgi:uncharacterized membrane protein YfcA
VALMVVAGVAAGTVNTIVGSGSLSTFPSLLALGYTPVTANIANTLGLFPGSVSGAVGYRRELVGQRGRAVRLGLAALMGGITGSLLLLTLPAATFELIVPFLILLACGLMAVQPWLTKTIAQRGRSRVRVDVLAPVAVFGTAVYGGYFGAAQGVLLMAFLAIFLNDELQRLNGLKNVLVAVANGVAALLFVAVAPIAWEAALLVGLGAIAGGQLGAVMGRRIPPALLRTLVIGVGALVAVRLLVA